MALVDDREPKPVARKKKQECAPGPGGTFHGCEHRELFAFSLFSEPLPSGPVVVTRGSDCPDFYASFLRLSSLGHIELKNAVF